MKNIYFIFTLLLNAQWVFSAQVEHVIIMSIDGGKPLTMQQSKMPMLRRIVFEGAHTWKAMTITPSITLPSHVSMLTGVGPDIHQITWNDWDPKKGLVKVPTVFDLAQAHGYKTALFAAKDKFKHLQVPGVNEFRLIEKDAEDVAAVAANYFITNKPNLTFIHFRDADRLGHIFGWDSWPQKLALQGIDRAIKRIYDSIQKSGVMDRTVLIITADHGGSGFNHSDNTLENRTIPWIIWGATIQPNFTIMMPVHTTSTAATALHLLNVPVPENWFGKPIWEAQQ